METTIEIKHLKPSLTKFQNPVFIYINDEIKLRLSNVYIYDDLAPVLTFKGDIKLFSNEALYVVFNENHMQEFTMKGYKNCYFIPNLFKLKEEGDKYGKLFLSCNPDIPNCTIKHYPIGCYTNGQLDKKRALNDLRMLVGVRNNNPYLFTGFTAVKNKISLYGEAIEIIKH